MNQLVEIDRLHSIRRSAFLCCLSTGLIVGCTGQSESAKEVLAAVHVNDNQRSLPGTTVSSAESKELSEDFVFENKSNSKVIVKLMGRNCSCVKVDVGGRLLSVRDEFGIEPRSTKRINISRSLIAGGSTKAEILTTVHPLGSETSQSMVCSAEQALYPDIYVYPGLIRTELNDKFRQKNMDVVVTATSADPDTLSDAELRPNSVFPGAVVEVNSSRTREQNGVHFKEWNASVTIDSKLAGVTERKMSGAVNFEVVASNGVAAPKYAVALPVAVTNKFGLEAPSEIGLGAVKSGQQKLKRFRIVSNTGEPFEILSIRAKSDNFRVQAESEDSRTTHWLTVAFDSNAHGEHEECIELETTCESMPSIQIRFFAVTI